MEGSMYGLNMYEVSICMEVSMYGVSLYRESRFRVSMHGGEYV